MDMRKFSEIHTMLSYLKDNDIDNYHRVFKILKFIYGDAHNERLLGFIESKNGILSFLNDISKNPDKRFFNKVFDSVELFLDMVDARIYDQHNFNVESYIINIYSMLKSYDVYRDNYDFFSEIVDDNKKFFFTLPEQDNYKLKKRFIDEIIAIPNFLNFPRLRYLYHDVLSLSTFTYEREVVEELLNTLSNIYKYSKDLENEGFVIDEMNLQNVINFSIYHFVGESLKEKTLEGVNKNEILVSKNILLGNRYQYVSNKLHDVEENPYIRHDIFNFINSCGYELFAFLNSKNAREDSFITCMNIVFDSDTYIEIYKKINVLKELNNKYKNGNIDKSISLDDIITSLNSDLCKEKNNGLTISYKTNSQNKIIKPKRIIERMDELYREMNMYSQSEKLSYLAKDVKDIETLILKISKAKNISKDIEQKETDESEQPISIEKEPVKKMKKNRYFLLKKNN